VQGPEVWLKELGIELACVVDPASPALLDPEHRVFVNWETYYLSRDAAVTAFRQTPWEFSGPVTDPVSRARFVPTAASPRRERGDRLFLFENGETLARFDADPAAYEMPMIGMVPKDEAASAP